MLLRIASLILAGTISIYPTVGTVTELTPVGAQAYSASVIVPVDETTSFKYYALVDGDTFIGDTLALIMSDNGTPEVADDSIVDIKYISNYTYRY